jgi:hypothetical protein
MTVIRRALINFKNLHGRSRLARKGQGGQTDGGADALTVRGQERAGLTSSRNDGANCQG